MVFYTYLWLRDDGTPYYVGKGKLDRALYRHGNSRRFPAPPRERIILQDHESEEAAFAAEIFLIDFYGRKDLKTGCLLNLTSGGEGASGHVRSPESIEKLKNTVRNSPWNLSEDAKKRIGKANKGRSPWSAGKIMSQEFRQKCRDGVKKRPPISEETRLKMRMAKLGNTTRRGSVTSEETKMKQRLAKLGKKRTKNG
jgi:hypothetical protein